MRSVAVSPVAAALVLGLVCGAATQASADALLSGVVRDTNGSPIGGAFVSAVGSGGRFAARTDATGAYGMTVASGTDYEIVANAPGFTVASVPDVVAGDTPVVQDLTLDASGQVFKGLGVYGGQIGTILADGRSGIFYATTSVLPQLYRTADYGGTWSPVTLAIDDPDEGLDDSMTVFRGYAATTSGFPGDVAVVIGSTAYYSTDFGVTWDAVAGALPAGPGGTALHWGHAGATNILLAVAMNETGNPAGDVARADMNAATPTWTLQTTPYLIAGGALDVAHGVDGAYVAAVDPDGELSIYDLAENPPATPLEVRSGFPGSPTVIAFGGVAAPGAPPDTVLVYSEASGTVMMASKSGGTTLTTISAESTVPPDCSAFGGVVASIAPDSTGAAARGTLAACLVTQAGSGPLVLTRVNGINNNTGVAFDAGYDGAGNAVILAGDGARGIVKSAMADLGGIPVFPGKDAEPGTGADSGGVAVTGFTVPVVKDTTFGPAGPHQVATMLSFSGGALGLASEDGGASFNVAVARGGGATAWWNGAAGAWLVFGHGGDGELLTAILDWSSATPAFLTPNVPDATPSTIGTGTGGGAFAIFALAGVPDADLLFIGGGDAPPFGGAGSLYRAHLVPGSPPTLDEVTRLAEAELPAPVRALAYCPSAGSAPALADVLLVAAGSEAGAPPAGGLLRISNATAATPVVAVVDTVPSGMPVNDVRAHCASGTVYAGVGENNAGPSAPLYKSTDGAASFTAVALTAPGVPPNLNVRVVALDPANPDELLIAGNSEGFILRSSDGGGAWTVVNDPTAGGRNFMSEGVGDLEIPPPAAAGGSGALVVARAAALASDEALVATGGGLFAAAIRAGTGSGPCAGLVGLAAVDCELEQLGEPGICGETPLHPKFAKVFDRKVGKARRLVQKAAAALKTKRIAKLTRKADRTLGAIVKKAGVFARKARIDESCRQRIEQRVNTVRALLGGAG